MKRARLVDLKIGDMFRFYLLEGHTVVPYGPILVRGGKHYNMKYLAWYNPITNYHSAASEDVSVVIFENYKTVLKALL